MDHVVRRFAERSQEGGRVDALISVGPFIDSHLDRFLVGRGSEKDVNVAVPVGMVTGENICGRFCWPCQRLTGERQASRGISTTLPMPELVASTAASQTATASLKSKGAPERSQYSKLPLSTPWPEK